MSKLTKHDIVIYVANKVEWKDTFYSRINDFKKNFPVVHHLAKHLIVRHDKTRTKDNDRVLRKLQNVIRISEKDEKIIVKGYDWKKQIFTPIKNFDDFKNENLLQILFPDKSKTLNGTKLYVGYANSLDVFEHKGKQINKWSFFIDLIAEKFNPILRFHDIYRKCDHHDFKFCFLKLRKESRLDFYINFGMGKSDLESYNYMDYCFYVPWPKPHSFIELVLFLPLDKDCWMWLGITILFCTFLWRTSEGHWDFPFGAFAYFMGQSQNIVRIRTNRFAMKFLLQVLIFTIFIFTNGYQSIVTSFMLNPVEEKPFDSIDEILGSNMKFDTTFRQLQNNFKYQKAFNDGRILKFDSDSVNWTGQIVEMNVATLVPCKAYKNEIEHDGDGKKYKNLYLIPEVVFTDREDLYIRPYHPFVDVFQELMDRSFEAGLQQAWERFFYEIWTTENSKRKPKEPENDILDFYLIAPFFLILAVGFTAAFVALLCEIFCHDFVSKLSKDYFKRKIDEYLRTEIKDTKIKVKKNQKKSVNVRKIQVRPASEKISYNMDQLNLK